MKREARQALLRQHELRQPPAPCHIFVQRSRRQRPHGTCHRPPPAPSAATTQHGDTPWPRRWGAACPCTPASDKAAPGAVPGQGLLDCLLRRLLVAEGEAARDGAASQHLARAPAAALWDVVDDGDIEELSNQLEERIDVRLELGIGIAICPQYHRRRPAQHQQRAQQRLPEHVIVHDIGHDDQVDVFCPEARHSKVEVPPIEDLHIDLVEQQSGTAGRIAQLLDDLGPVGQGGELAQVPGRETGDRT
mmetsp:Transcript_27348/g.69185  ORF Transcript_27348/g.69185 Transcript_27348/m.69185 type:complete len:248 (-) Transcript_27348:238-981(-)